MRENTSRINIIITIKTFWNIVRFTKANTTEMAPAITSVTLNPVFNLVSVLSVWQLAHYATDTELFFLFGFLSGLSCFSCAKFPVLCNSGQMFPPHFDIPHW